MGSHVDSQFASENGEYLTGENSVSIQHGADVSYVGPHRRVEDLDCYATESAS